ESDEIHLQYFYIDYELYDDPACMDGEGYFHAEFHRENPFGGWGHEITVNTPEANIINKERTAWENNYVILETEGKGHYIGCNMSITNLQGTWWGEGDDMIWVDGYKWPPDLHGTGSEDYFNHAYGMQPNAFLRNGSSIHEMKTGGYQTSYVFHVENPVRFEKEIKVTIEHGHGNHLRNEVSSVAYWYSEKPVPVKQPPPVEKRQPVLKKGNMWIVDESSRWTTREIELNDEMLLMKNKWRLKDFPEHVRIEGELLLTENGLVALKFPFLNRPGSPLYVIPIYEILEDFLDKKVWLEVKIGDSTMTYQCTFKTEASGKLIAKIPVKTAKKEENVRFCDLVDSLVGSKVVLETLLHVQDPLDLKAEPDGIMIQLTKLPSK
ncbi:MAG: glycoside hydrolase family 172 protein, partial [Promethearchaeota archaeon]